MVLSRPVQIQLLWSWTWLHRDTDLGKGIDGIEPACPDTAIVELDMVA